MRSKNKFKNIKDDEIWNAENIYHLKTNISRIAKLIYHYEILLDIENDNFCKKNIPPMNLVY